MGGCGLDGRDTHDDGARKLGLALDRLRRGDRDGGKRGEDRDDGELHVGDERVVRKNGEEETKGMGGGYRKPIGLRKQLLLQALLYPSSTPAYPHLLTDGEETVPHRCRPQALSCLVV